VVRKTSGKAKAAIVLLVLALILPIFVVNISFTDPEVKFVRVPILGWVVARSPQVVATIRAETVTMTLTTTLYFTETEIMRTTKTVTVEAGVPTGFDTVQVSKLVADAINRMRQEHGRPPLRWDPRLASIAAGRTKDMATRFYYGHTSPEGGNPSAFLLKHGYPFRATGETLLLMQLSPDMETEEIVDRIVASWYNSTGHRAILLSYDYQIFGVGAYITQDAWLFVSTILVMP
jgi:uncharacterized protein YkwD